MVFSVLSFFDVGVDNQLRHLEAVRSIDRTLAQQDHATVRTLLLEMADILAVEPQANQRPDNGNPE